VWLYQATGTATAGQYEKTRTATSTDVNFSNFHYSASDTDHYFGAAPGLALVKLTNRTDNHSGTRPLVSVGSTVTWTYHVTNTGNVTLTNVVVTDDNGTPGNTADDFTVGTVASLAPGASTTLTATGTAKAGQYGNVGSVTGTPVDNNGNPVVGATNPTASN